MCTQEKILEDKIKVHPACKELHKITMTTGNSDYFITYDKDKVTVLYPYFYGPPKPVTGKLYAYYGCNIRALKTILYELDKNGKEDEHNSRTY